MTIHDTSSKNVGAPNPMYKTLEGAEGKNHEEYSTFNHGKGDKSQVHKETAGSSRIPPNPSEEYNILQLVKVNEFCCISTYDRSKIKSPKLLLDM